jgi:hypothetical protein
MARPIARCYLCKEIAQLCDSHLIPKAMYRLCMARDGRNRNPFVVTPEVHVQKSAQWHDYLLCEECERRMRVGGEDWVLKHCCRSTTGDPFLEAEDASFDAEAERRAVEETLKKLRSVVPTIQRLKENSDPD